MPMEWIGSRKLGHRYGGERARQRSGARLSHVRERWGFYGWPYSYYGQHVDTRVPQNPQMVAKAIVPDYALGNHTASLGLTFYGGSLFPQQYRGGAFVGQHGSWNRRPRSGYKVIFRQIAFPRSRMQSALAMSGTQNSR